MADRFIISALELGAMKLLFLPWICKPLYAPFVEKTRSKKWWLVFSMTLLGMACIMVSPRTVLLSEAQSIIYNL
jgi:hypothetical protein